jgi:hypothetical protein
MHQFLQPPVTTDLDFMCQPQRFVINFNFYEWFTKDENDTVWEITATRNIK